jgi:hypothetical protein
MNPTANWTLFIDSRSFKSIIKDISFGYRLIEEGNYNAE